MSRPVTDWAKPAEIARFLRIEPEDVDTLIESDGLPATKIPSKTRIVKRIWLKDLHQWLMSKTINSSASAAYCIALSDFEYFRTEFQKHRAAPRKSNKKAA